jgi:steroid 5-alpha reductase family enzyme
MKMDVESKLSLAAKKKSISLLFILVSASIYFLIQFLLKETSSIDDFWKPCGELMCATLMVPMNHLDPNSKLIGIAMNKYSAKNQPALKTVFTNPGGPGGS